MEPVSVGIDEDGKIHLHGAGDRETKCIKDDTAGVTGGGGEQFAIRRSFNAAQGQRAAEASRSWLKAQREANEVRLRRLRHGSRE